MTDCTLRPLDRVFNQAFGIGYVSAILGGAIAVQFYSLDSVPIILEASALRKLSALELLALES